MKNMQLKQNILEDTAATEEEHEEMVQLVFDFEAEHELIIHQALDTELGIHSKKQSQKQKDLSASMV